MRYIDTYITINDTTVGVLDVESGRIVTYLLNDTTHNDIVDSIKGHVAVILNSSKNATVDYNPPKLAKKKLDLYMNGIMPDLFNQNLVNSKTKYEIIDENAVKAYSFFYPQTVQSIINRYKDKIVYISLMDELPRATNEDEELLVTIFVSNNSLNCNLTKGTDLIYNKIITISAYDDINILALEYTRESVMLCKRDYAGAIFKTIVIVDTSTTEDEFSTQDSKKKLVDFNYLLSKVTSKKQKENVRGIEGIPKKPFNMLKRRTKEVPKATGNSIKSVRESKQKPFSNLLKKKRNILEEETVQSKRTVDSVSSKGKNNIPPKKEDNKNSKPNGLKLSSLRKDIKALIGEEIKTNHISYADYLAAHNSNRPISKIGHLTLFTKRNVLDVIASVYGPFSLAFMSIVLAAVIFMVSILNFYIKELDAATYRAEEESIRMELDQIDMQLSQILSNEFNAAEDMYNDRITDYVNVPKVLTDLSSLLPKDSKVRNISISNSGVILVNIKYDFNAYNLSNIISYINSANIFEPVVMEDIILTKKISDINLKLTYLNQMQTPEVPNEELVPPIEDVEGTEDAEDVEGAEGTEDIEETAPQESIER